MQPEGQNPTPQPITAHLDPQPTVAVANPDPQLIQQLPPPTFTAQQAQVVTAAGPPPPHVQPGVSQYPPQPVAQEAYPPHQGGYVQQGAAPGVAYPQQSPYPPPGGYPEQNKPPPYQDPGFYPPQGPTLGGTDM